MAELIVSKMAAGGDRSTDAVLSGLTSRAGLQTGRLAFGRANNSLETSVEPRRKPREMKVRDEARKDEEK